ncbi:MAG: PLP-dependent aspartate aminotransferase family protein [Gemmatimonadota bacterium]
MTHDTLLARAADFLDRTTGAVVPPLHTSTTFTRDTDYELLGDSTYARYGGPTVRHAESILRELEDAEDALLFSSGMSAATVLLETLSSGDRVVAPTIMYHGTQDWFRRLAERRGITVSFFDATEPGALRASLSEGPTTLVWVESPVNPTWDVIDIRDAATAAHDAGALLVADSTVAPPVTTQALSEGADIVLHSATKYLNGHSDVLGGVLATRNPDARWEEIASVRKYTGTILAPFEAWLLIRGLRTLSLRFDRSSANALEIARHFEDHSAIERCLYPGLPSHPGHAVAKRQMRRGFGGMLSMLVRDDPEGVRARSIATALKHFAPATSLGGVESLVEHRASVEGPHSLVPKNLLRFSIGIEDVTDLIEDLESVLGAR